jgi:WD40 repeat protein
LWDFTKGTLLHALESDAFGIDDITKLTFSPDGKLAAFGVFDGIGEFGAAISVFDVASGNLLSREGNWDELIFSISADDRLIATGCDGYDHQGVACFYNVQSGDFVSSFDAEIGDDRITSIGLSSDGQTLAAGTMWGRVLLWNTNGGDLLHMFNGQTRNVTHLVFSPDGQTLASVSEDGTVVLWDLSQ